MPTIYGDADFRPLEELPIKWRWTEPKYNILPPDALATIRPLTEAKADELWWYSSNFLKRFKAPGQLELSEQDFSPIQRIDTADTKVQEVREWLQTLSVEDDPLVCVSWTPAWAVMTTWSVFCQYWDDFCYPMSDDVTIWPLSESWVLLYWHEERLIFGNSKSIGTATGTL